MSTKFTGTIKILEMRARERSGKYSSNGEFQKLLNIQKLLGGKVEAIESLMEAEGEESEEILRYAEKFKNELPGIRQEFQMAAEKYNSSMLAGAYEHSKLIPGAHDEEIRSVFRSLSTADKFSFIVKAMEEKNGRVLSAILHDGVPSVLVGVPAEMRTKYRDDFFKFVIPDFMEVWNNYQDLFEHVEATFGVAQDAARTFSDEKKLAALSEIKEMHTTAKSKLDGGTL